MTLANSLRGIRDAIGAGRVVSLLAEKTGGRTGAVANDVETRGAGLNTAAPSPGEASDSRQLGSTLGGAPDLSKRLVKVKAKNVHVGDHFGGCQVVHKETTANGGIVLLTLGCGESKQLRPWLWGNETVEVQRPRKFRAPRR